jgi:hypothetical protein
VLQLCCLVQIYFLMGKTETKNQLSLMADRAGPITAICNQCLVQFRKKVCKASLPHSQLEVVWSVLVICTECDFHSHLLLVLYSLDSPKTSARRKLPKQNLVLFPLGFIRSDTVTKTYAPL